MEFDRKAILYGQYRSRRTASGVQREVKSFHVGEKAFAPIAGLSAADAKRFLRERKIALHGPAAIDKAALRRDAQRYKKKAAKQQARRPDGVIRKLGTRTLPGQAPIELVLVREKGERRVRVRQGRTLLATAAGTAKDIKRHVRAALANAMAGSDPAGGEKPTRGAIRALASPETDPDTRKLAAHLVERARQERGAATMARAAADVRRALAEGRGVRPTTSAAATVAANPGRSSPQAAGGYASVLARAAKGQNVSQAALAEARAFLAARSQSDQSKGKPKGTRRR